MTAAIALLTVGSVTGAAQSAPARFCLRFDQPFFKWAMDWPPTSAHIDSTALVALDTTHHQLFNTLGARRIRPLFRQDAQDSSTRLFEANAYWRRIGRDTLELRWGGGIAGFNIRVAGVDTLRGTVEEHSDVPRLDAAGRRQFGPWTAPTVAIRVVCPR